MLASLKRKVPFRMGVQCHGCKVSGFMPTALCRRSLLRGKDALKPCGEVTQELLAQQRGSKAGCSSAALGQSLLKMHSVQQLHLGQHERKQFPPASPKLMLLCRTCGPLPPALCFGHVTTWLELAKQRNARGHEDGKAKQDDSWTAPFELTTKLCRVCSHHHQKI